jgi:hypothetical protein
LLWLSFAAFCEPPIAGCIGVGIVEVLPTGWVFIGPVVDLLLGIVDNSAKPSWFEKKKTTTVNRQREARHKCRRRGFDDLRKRRDR